MNPRTDSIEAESIDWEWCIDDATDRREGGWMSERNSPVKTLYEGSNGRYYTEWQVHERLRAGEWKPCIEQRSPDRRLIGTDDEELLLLLPVDPVELPTWAEIRIDGRGARVVDTRRGSSR